MRFLITAGPTREYIDPVRFISNASSGKMGYALAGAALKAGHEVTLITAPTALPLPKGINAISVETSRQMLSSVRENFNKCNCLIMAAAVADYTAVHFSRTKIKKSDRPLTIRLKPVVDILKWAGKNKKKNQLVVGFALEDKRIRSRAEEKLKEKNLDMIIANTPSAIGSDKSTLQIKTPHGKWIVIPETAKTASAKKIIAIIEKMS